MANESTAKIDSENLKKAEEFADFMESEMGALGSTGNYFCTEQRARWRQHAVRAFLGQSPELVESQVKSETTVTRSKAKR